MLAQGVKEAALWAAAAAVVAAMQSEARPGTRENISFPAAGRSFFHLDRNPQEDPGKRSAGNRKRNVRQQRPRLEPADRFM